MSDVATLYVLDDYVLDDYVLDEWASFTRMWHEHLTPAAVLELDIDRCQNTYGVAPCTAAGAVGGECYNSFATCQDKANYNRGTRTIKFCSRGMPIPAGETLRPYLTDVNSTPTEIVASKGLAMRGQTSVTLVDEPCADVLDDPYAATRQAAAGGSFWTRFLARNPNHANRFARVRRGYLTTPFSWGAFQTELYVITAIQGPDAQGKVKVILSDAVRLLDTARIPLPTDGKAVAELRAYADAGTAQVGSTATTIVLRSEASAIDDAYNGMEVYLAGNTGAGQRRTITDYVGATRTATVAAWSVTPDATTGYEVSALSLTLATGKGAQYADPATSGKPEYVRLGDEVIRYTAKAGDVLSWPDATHRAQFGTTRADHKADELVQLCRAFVNQSVPAVIEALYNEAGLADAYIDLAQLAAEDANWLGSKANITTCITAPEKASDLLADLLIDLNAAAWWDAVAQKAKFRVNMPEISSSTQALTDDQFLLGSLKVERQESERITQAASYYELKSATADRKKEQNYLRADVYVDTDAQSANEYGDTRPDVRLSRWLTANNSLLTVGVVARRLARRRDAPMRFTFQLDPRDAVTLGELRDITTRRVVGPDGQPKLTQVRIVKVEDVDGHQDVVAQSTAFGRRYGFIAPNGQPDYVGASDAQRAYAYISNTATGRMNNGDGGYYIL